MTSGSRPLLEGIRSGFFSIAAKLATSSCNMGALIIRIGFWGPLYYNDNKEPPKQYC